MLTNTINKLIILTSILFYTNTQACSIVYYIDSTTGKIYVANNEDYWYDVKDYIQIVPQKKDQNARLWYGWNKFAQGGVNSKGLFFDAAATPKQIIPTGYSNPNGRNVGDEILAYCDNVAEAIDYLEKEKIAISEGHIMLGDASGNAVILEWLHGKKEVIKIESNVLIATNYLISDINAGNYPCYRYQSIEANINKLKKSKEKFEFKDFANVISGAVQVPQKDNNGKQGGTLYTTFINISDMELVLVPKLNNSNFIKLDLNNEFTRTRKKKIKLP